MLDVGCWMLGVGCWMLDVGCWVLDVGCWVLDVDSDGLGQVVSELLRRTLGLSAEPDDAPATELERRNGFAVFPERTGPEATIEGVQQLCREEGL